MVVLWPPVSALLISFGVSQAHRYWVAKDPDSISMLFSNAIIFGLAAGVASLLLAELIVPHLVGVRSPETMRWVRIYQINTPAALMQLLMVGLLDGARRFGWAGISRLIFFGVQAVAYLVLWSTGRLTLATAALTMMLSQFSSMLFAVMAVRRQLRPRWQLR